MLEIFHGIAKHERYSFIIDREAEAAWVENELVGFMEDIKANIINPISIFDTYHNHEGEAHPESFKEGLELFRERTKEKHGPHIKIIVNVWRKVKSRRVFSEDFLGKEIVIE